MIPLVRAEARKLTSTQVWAWMLLACLVITILGVVAAIAGTPTAELAADTRAALQPVTSGISTLLLFALGTLALTTDHRHQTLTPALLTTPIRTQLLTAKLLTYGLVGSLYALACTLTALALALPWLHARHVTVELSAAIPAYATGLALAALFTLLGVGLGALLRNQALALSLGIVFLTVLSNLLVLIPVAKHAYPYLPNGAASAITATAHERHGFNGVDLLPTWGGYLTLTSWALGLAALAAATSLRRDVT